MYDIARILKSIFEVAKQVPAKTGIGLIQHGTGKLAIQGLEKITFTVRGTKIGLSELSEEEQKAAKEVVEYMTRYIFAYLEHHDENIKFRLNTQSGDDLFWSHAREITEAATQAFASRLRSHGYDFGARKLGVPKTERVSIFQNEDVIKQLILNGLSTSLKRFVDHLDAESKRREKTPRPMAVQYELNGRYYQKTLSCTQLEALSYGRELLEDNPNIEEIRICTMTQGEVKNMVYNYVNGYWIDEARRQESEDRRASW